MDLSIIIPIFVSIFAIIDPIGNVPLFVALTHDHTNEEKKRVIKKIIIVATTTLIIFSLVGQYIFTLFSITIPAFQIAGGILIFKLGFDMIQGSRPKAKRTDNEKEEAMEKEAIGIVPLGIPIFAGPGSISAVMLYISQPQNDFTSTLLQLLIVILSVIITMIISYILLTNSTKIFEKTGRMGTLAISRIMGLIITAMAVQFIINGIFSVLVSWGVFL